MSHRERAEALGWERCGSTWSGGTVGMACDHVDWARLLEWMEERP